MVAAPQEEHRADGPVPMQIALTPFPPNVDVAKLLQARKAKGRSPDLVMAERKQFQHVYRRRSVSVADQDTSSRSSDASKGKQVARISSVDRSTPPMRSDRERNKDLAAGAPSLQVATRKTSFKEWPAGKTATLTMAAPPPSTLIPVQLTVPDQLGTDSPGGDAEIQPTARPISDFKLPATDSHYSTGSPSLNPARTTSLDCDSVGPKENHEDTVSTRVSLSSIPNVCVDKSNGKCVVRMNASSDANLTCNVLPDSSSPVAGKLSVGSGQESGKQASRARLTSSPLRRSARLLNTLSADGISAADEDMMQKSMRRTAWKNLDGAVEQENTATRSPSMTNSMSSNPHSLDSIPDDRCVSRLNKLGFRLCSSNFETTLAIKALKNIDLDRLKVTPKKAATKKPSQTQMDPFDVREDEDA
jgi:hypothetical protein